MQLAYISFEQAVQWRREGWEESTHPKERESGGGVDRRARQREEIESKLLYNIIWVIISHTCNRHAHLSPLMIDEPRFSA